MRRNVIYIKQPLLARILGHFKFNSLDISEIELDSDTWYENEGEFVWSYPNARVKLTNTDKVVLTMKCPLGRDVVIKSKYFAHKRSLKRDKLYTFVIDTKNLNEFFIHTTTYTCSGDDRELGLCFYNIGDKL